MTQLLDHRYPAKANARLPFQQFIWEQRKVDFSLNYSENTIRGEISASEKEIDGQILGWLVVTPQSDETTAVRRQDHFNSMCLGYEAADPSKIPNVYPSLTQPEAGSGDCGAPLRESPWPATVQTNVRPPRQACAASWAVPHRFLEGSPQSSPWPDRRPG